MTTHAASLPALDDDGGGVDEDDEDDGVDEDDNGNVSVIFLLYSMHEHLDLCMISHMILV
jgi:hypothetical protein